MALAAGGGGGTTGVATGLPRTALLALARFDSAPPTNPATCVFHNNVLFTRTIADVDSVHTQFASISVSPHCSVSRNDTLRCDSCTVAVTVTRTPESYQFDVGPASRVVNQTGEPVATVSFGRYDDPTVYTRSSRSASAAAVEQALELWRERTPHRWGEGRNSSYSGPAAATSALESPGSYLVGTLK